MKKFLSLILILGCFSFSGCILLLLGGAATGGYALSTDGAEGVVDASYNKVWDSAIEVMEEDGIIKVQDEKHGRIEAEVDTINMKVEIDKIGRDSVKLKVSGRKHLMPKAKQAEKEFVKILERSK
jgi:hypothetical protein